MYVDRDAFGSTKYVSVFAELILATNCVLCGPQYILWLLYTASRHGNILQVCQDQNSSGIFTAITIYQCGD